MSETLDKQLEDIAAKYQIDLDERFIDLDGRFYPIEIDGTKNSMVSVTTVLDLVRVKGFLDKWMSEMYELLGVDGYKKFLNKKADEGTATHNLIEFYLQQVMKGVVYPIDRYNIEALEIMWDKDRPMTTNHVNNYAWKKFQRWQEWFHQAGITKVHWTEKKLYSEFHRCAGTADAKLTGPDGTFVYDWKSGKGQEKHKTQGSTYHQMDAEIEGKACDGVKIISLGEDTKKGWKETSVLNNKDHKWYKGSEIDYYFRDFLLRKELMYHHFQDLEAKNATLNRYVLTTNG